MGEGVIGVVDVAKGVVDGAKSVRFEIGTGTAVNGNEVVGDKDMSCNHCLLLLPILLGKDSITTPDPVVGGLAIDGVLPRMLNRVMFGCLTWFCNSTPTCWCLMLAWYICLRRAWLSISLG